MELINNLYKIFKILIVGQFVVDKYRSKRHNNCLYDIAEYFFLQLGQTHKNMCNVKNLP